MPSKGLKQQVFGGVLVCIAAMTALLSRVIGFELDIFYVIIGVAGAGILGYGLLQASPARYAKARQSGNGS